MANVDDPVGNQPAGTPGGSDSSAISDPRDARIAELERYASESQATFERLKPYEADITAILDGDDGFREFQRTARESYYDTQKRLAKEREEEIPESERRILSAIDERLNKFAPVLQDYDNRAKTQEQAAKDASNDFAKREIEYADRLVAEGRITSDQVNKLAKYAMVLHKESVDAGTPRFVGIEEVYKEIYGGIEARVTAAKPVARSLRSTAGVTGVPGASKAPEDRSNLAKPGGITRHVLGVLNNQRKTG